MMPSCPVIEIGGFPRVVEAVHQIEITSRCNLRCRYCPSPTLQRPKLDMTRPIFEKAIAAARYFFTRPLVPGPAPMDELNLAGIGESTLHPDFAEFISYARQELGPTPRLVLATNGISMTREIADAMAAHNVRAHVSLHRPEKAAHAVNLLRERGVLLGVSTDPATASVNWAGQVDWPQTSPALPCIWLRHGFVAVMADGRVTTCSLDASGAGVIASVNESPASWRTRPYSLCAGCHQDINVAGYAQRTQPG